MKEFKYHSNEKDISTPQMKQVYASNVSSDALLRFIELEEEDGSESDEDDSNSVSESCPVQSINVIPSIKRKRTENKQNTNVYLLRINYL